MFPPFRAPQNKNAFNTFFASLKHSRQGSLDMPIHFPSTLWLLHECRNPEPPAGSRLSLPETCRIPSIFLPDAHSHLFQETYPLADVTLTLTEPLLTGIDHLSQTYCGHINHRGYEPGDAIVKLFQ